MHVTVVAVKGFEFSYPTIVFVSSIRSNRAATALHKPQSKSMYCLMQSQALRQTFSKCGKLSPALSYFSLYKGIFFPVFPDKRVAKS